MVRRRHPEGEGVAGGEARQPTRGNKPDLPPGMSPEQSEADADEDECGGVTEPDGNRTGRGQLDQAFFPESQPGEADRDGDVEGVRLRLAGVTDDGRIQGEKCHRGGGRPAGEDSPRHCNESEESGDRSEYRDEPEDVFVRPDERNAALYQEQVADRRGLIVVERLDEPGGRPVADVEREHRLVRPERSLREEGGEPQDEAEGDGGAKGGAVRQKNNPGASRATGGD
jgi:hypothetical protein